MTEKREATFQVFKKSAALRINIQKASEDRNGFPKAGGYFVKFAKAADGGSNKYDWENAVTFFLAANEVMTFCRMIERDHDVKLYHDPDKGRENEGTRAKQVSAGESNGTTYLNILMGETKIGIALSPDEISSLTTLLRSSVRECYGW